MVKVSENLTLVPIAISDQKVLFSLMSRIYPSAYAHYWKDDCSWYLNTIYGTENLRKELEEVGTSYFFVRFRESVTETTIGILKVNANCTYPAQPDAKAYKIHRIYLDPEVQGKGIGKDLMHFTETHAKASNHKLIWLDAMDTHEQAQAFYKKLGYIKGDLQHLPFELLNDEHRPMWYMHKPL